MNTLSNQINYNPEFYSFIKITNLKFDNSKVKLQDPELLFLQVFNYFTMKNII